MNMILKVNLTLVSKGVIHRAQVNFQKQRSINMFRIFSKPIINSKEVGRHALRTVLHKTLENF